METKTGEGKSLAILAEKLPKEEREEQTMKNMIRRPIGILLVAVMLLTLIPAGIFGASAEEPYSVYVSADGDDTAAGTQDAPVATIGKAFEKCKGETEAVVYLIGKLTCADIGTLPSGVTSLTVAGYGTDSALVLTGHILKYNSTIKRLIFKNLKIVVEANYMLAFAPVPYVGYENVSVSSTSGKGIKTYAVHHGATKFDNLNTVVSYGTGTGTITEASISGSGNNSGNVTFDINGGNVGWLHTANANGSGLFTGNITVKLSAGSIQVLNMGGAGAATSVKGNVYINVDGGKIVQVQSNGKTIDGDVIFTINDFTSAENSFKTFKGTTVSAGHKRVLLLNNGKQFAAETNGNGIQNMDVIIRAPQKVYSTAVLHEDGTFANKINVSWADSTFDRVVLKNEKGDILGYSTDASKTATFDVAADGEYTLIGENTSKTYIRGWQPGTDGTSIRFVASLDDLNCSGAGMEITAVAGDVTKTFGTDASGVTKTVYGSIKGGGMDYTAADLATAYIHVAVVEGLPTGVEITFTVKPFKMVEGERIYGEETTVVYTVSSGN